MISQLLEYHHFRNTTIFWRIPPFFGEYHHFLERPTVRDFPSVRGRLPIRSPWRRQMASPSRPKWQGRQVAGNDKWIIISFDQNPGWKLVAGDDDDKNSYNNNNNNHNNDDNDNNNLFLLLYDNNKNEKKNKNKNKNQINNNDDNNINNLNKLLLIIITNIYTITYTIRYTMYAKTWR